MDSGLRRSPFGWVLMILLFSVSVQVWAQEAIVNQDPAFTLKLPDGFVPHMELVSAAPNILHGFCLGDFDDDQPDILLFVEKMRGTIGREKLRPEDMPPGFTGRHFQTKWKGFEVDAFEVPEQLEGLEVLTYNVQIPLKRTAIQVKLFGPADRRQEMEDLLPQILGGLDGPTNWIGSGIEGSQLASSPYYRYVLLGIGLTILIGGFVALFLLSRRSPKGTVLVVAIMIWAFGASVAAIREREMLMIGGSLKLLGFTGTILGIVDLVRRRRRPEPPLSARSRGSESDTAQGIQNEV